MSDLEKFLHAEDGIPAVLRAGLAHAQFETIHPFLDGNGRTGRMLITLMLLDRGVLCEPVLYLSLFLKQHRSDYYDLLDRVRTHGDWEAWLVFFLEGVQTTAVSAFDTTKQLEDMAAAHREAVRAVGRASGSAMRVHQAFMEFPMLNASECPCPNRPVDANDQQRVRIARRARSDRRGDRSPTRPRFRLHRLPGNPQRRHRVAVIATAHQASSAVLIARASSEECAPSVR